ncbi:MAG: response regulator receiver protein [Caulobacter sp.]|nr:response regulator receiver protein [Caulobacter sp.]
MEARVQLRRAFYYSAQADLRLLFVDDDPILREFASVHLASEHMRLETAADGAEGLAAIAADRPDLVLLDLDMPNVDGFEVLRRLRADPATEHLPVIVVTGREDTAAIDRAFDAGATSFIAKPINWRLLNYQVRYVHRTHVNEDFLLEERNRLREGGARADAALKAVAREGSRFLGQALRVNPDLREAAAAFAAAVEAAANPPDTP